MRSPVYLKSMISTTLIFIALSGCAGSKPDSIGVHDNQLSSCPESPNCVSSDAQDEEHKVVHFRLRGDPQKSWAQMVEVVESLTRTTIVTKTETYVHAECRSKLFRFVDDLELLLNPATGIVSIRSASRLGYSDLGVNRKRYKSLRRDLLEKKIIEE